MCASFDPARNETCACARFSPYAQPPLQIIGDTQHFVCGLYAFRGGYEKVTARFQVAKETAVGASRCAVKAAEKGGGTLRSSPYAIFGFVLALICATPGLAGQAPQVLLNHVFVTPDAATYAAIQKSVFLRAQFAAMEERTTVRPDTTYSGLYFYGTDTYIEIAQSRALWPVGTTGIGLSVDRASELPALQARFASTLGSRGDEGPVTRQDASGKQVPWFTILGVPYDTGKAFGTFVLAYDARFLAQWYPQYPPAPGSTTRAATLNRYVAKIRKTSVRDNGIFENIEGVELSGQPPRKLCAALGARLSGSGPGSGSCTLGSVRLRFSGSGTLHVCTLKLRLKREQPNEVFEFGGSELRLSGLHGRWSFCGALANNIAGH
jgi:hypothetical protein